MRFLNRNRFYAAVSLVGLTAGLALCILTTVFVLNELSYDSWYSHSDNMFRVLMRRTLADGQIVKTSNQAFPLGPVLQADLPDIKAVTRWSTSLGVVTCNGSSFHERLHFADEESVSLFDFQFLQGNPQVALLQPQSVIITRSTAIKYFGTEKVFGRRLTISMSNATEDYFITGIVDDIPPNASFTFNLLLPFEKHPLYSILNTNWARNDVSCSVLILLKDNIDPSQVAPKLQSFVLAYFREVIASQQQAYKLAQGESAFQLELQPVRRIHLDPSIFPSQELTSDPLRIYVLIAISILILAIACANFIVLTLAQSAARSKEVAVRKVLGSNRKSIVIQFWFEALVLCTLSFLVALFLAMAFRPVFSRMINQNLPLDLIPPFAFIIVSVVLLAGLSLVAGLVPGLFISRLKAIEALKRTVRISKNHVVTKSLIVGQFTIAAVLVAFALTMSSQLHFLLAKDLGYEATSVISISLNGVSLNERDNLISTLRNSLGSDPRVADISSTSGEFMLNFQDKDESKSAYFSRVGDSYASLLGLSLTQGRDWMSSCLQSCCGYWLLPTVTG